MKEAIIIALIIIVFLYATYKVHVVLLKVKPIWFIIISVAYLILTYPYFELINYVHVYLRDHGYYIEFGHASELLIEVFFACLIIALINIGIAAVRKMLYKRAGS